MKIKTEFNTNKFWAERAREWVGTVERSIYKLKSSCSSNEEVFDSMHFEKSRRLVMGKLYWECDAHICICRICENVSSFLDRIYGRDVLGFGRSTYEVAEEENHVGWTRNHYIFSFDSTIKCNTGIGGKRST